MIKENRSTKSLKIKRITPKGKKVVKNVSVHNNHSILHEKGFVISNCDGLSQDAMKLLRGFIEEYSKHSTFIMTANYKDQLIEPLRNRFIHFDFDAIYSKSKKEIGLQILNRLKFILDNENVSFENKDLSSIVSNLYPSVREMVLSLQKASTSGGLIIDDSMTNNNSKYEVLCSLLKEKKFTEYRKSIMSMDDPSSFYTFMFKKLDNYVKSSSQPQMVLLCAKYQDMASSARDKTLTATAFGVEIMGSNIEFV